MLLPKQIKTEAAEYSRMGTKSLCSGVDEKWVEAPNQDGVQLRQRFVAHQKELCSLKKKTEESKSTLKMQLAEIKMLQKLTDKTEDLLRLLLSSKRWRG
jgi:flagellar biosynthesis chaperone FliJ